MPPRRAAQNSIEELGSEDTGEWDLGEWSKRYELAKKLKTKLRPALVRKLSEETLDENEAYEFIEEWLDRVLELEDSAECLYVGVY